MPIRKPKIPADWISLPQACREGRMSWGATYRLILVGEIEAVQVGRDWLVNPRSLAEFLKQREAK